MIACTRCNQRTFVDDQCLSCGWSPVQDDEDFQERRAIVAAQLVDEMPLAEGRLREALLARLTEDDTSWPQILDEESSTLSREEGRFVARFLDHVRVMQQSDDGQAMRRYRPWRCLLDAPKPSAGNALDAAIDDDPADRHNFEVYADWLLERGDPRAELVQVQLARELQPHDRELRQREHALLNDPRIFGELAGDLAMNRLGIECAHGFARKVVVRHPEAYALAIRSPITRFAHELIFATWGFADAIARDPIPSRFWMIEVVEDFSLFAHLPTTVEWLTIRAEEAGDLVERLVASGILRHVTHLSFDVPLWDTDCDAMIRSRAFGHLEYLFFHIHTMSESLRSQLVRG